MAIIYQVFRLNEENSDSYLTSSNGKFDKKSDICSQQSNCQQALLIRIHFSKKTKSVMNKISIYHPPLTSSNHRNVRWPHCPDTILGLPLSQAARAADAPLLVITPDTLSLEKLAIELAFFLEDDAFTPIMTFPDWEILPYDHFSPQQAIISERLNCLAKMQHLTRGIVLISISTLLHRLPPVVYIEQYSFALKRKDKLDGNNLKERLIRCGYRHVNQVIEHGEFTIRGSIVDVFPMGNPVPYRIDLFDDEIDTIRSFDPDNQRSLESLQAITCLPAHEIPLDEASILRFRENWRETFSGNPNKCPLYQDISDGFAAPGIEYYLPFFFEAMSTFLDYLPKNTIVAQLTKIQSNGEKFYHDTRLRYEQRCHDVTRPLLLPSQILVPVQDIFQQLKSFHTLHLTGATDNSTAFTLSALPKVNIERKNVAPFSLLLDYINHTQNRVLFCVESPGRREVLSEMLIGVSINPTVFTSWLTWQQAKEKIGIIIAPLSRGITLHDPDIAILTESDLFEHHVVSHRKNKTIGQNPETLIRDLLELSIGDPIVHIEHGIGFYQGLQNLAINEQVTEFLIIEYHGGDKLYVPVTSLDLINRYTGTEKNKVQRHKLGTEQWQKAKKKAAEQIRDVAAELLELYAKRAAKSGVTFNAPDQEYYQFQAQFPYEETPDQHTAIAAVISDMVSSKTMDRLICGDVGFGKTEVAIRAAFIAVHSQRQVALLVPTTLLAQQHYENFVNRFADWPVSIEMLSRFRSKREQEIIIKKLATGDVDIIIGTHGLLREGIAFHNLGLLIIDEEHRFGVGHKEKMKSLRQNVDILTLTATPIPRTLNMALSGIRDLSLITTPPVRRLAVKTFVQESNATTIREAILRETMRGGQVYYVHNEIRSIDRRAQELSELLPEVRMQIAHGQMHEKELEQIMTEFYHQQFHVLICTSIIESGLDIPSANTIIIDRADKFGISQLHQLRGRVGRSHHQAYAYLLTPNHRELTKDAIKRLEAISCHEDLGVGFLLATHDLEIRGAGELLGEEQSGNMHAIGFSLYMELLERTIDSLKSGKEPEFNFTETETTEIDLQIPALIPQQYIEDIHTRLSLYKRIASTKTDTELTALKIEMIDRFGKLPDPCHYLFQITALKHKAKILGIKKLEAGNKGGRIEFHDKPNIDPMIIIKLIQNRSQQYQLDGPSRLKFTFGSDTPEKRIEVVKKVLACFDSSPC